MSEAEELTSVLSDPRKIVATLLRRGHVSRPCLNTRSNAIAPMTVGQFPELFAWFSECPSSDLRSSSGPPRTTSRLRFRKPEMVWRGGIPSYMPILYIKIG
jgi:hypothetical protein